MGNREKREELERLARAWMYARMAFEWAPGGSEKEREEQAAETMAGKAFLAALLRIFPDEKEPAND